MSKTYGSVVPYRMPSLHFCNQNQFKVIAPDSQVQWASYSVHCVQVVWARRYVANKPSKYWKWPAERRMGDSVRIAYGWRCTACGKRERVRHLMGKSEGKRVNCCHSKLVPDAERWVAMERPDTYMSCFSRIVTLCNRQTDGQTDIRAFSKHPLHCHPWSRTMQCSTEWYKNSDWSPRDLRGRSSGWPVCTTRTSRPSSKKSIARQCLLAGRPGCPAPTTGIGTD